MISLFSYRYLFIAGRVRSKDYKTIALVMDRGLGTLPNKVDGYRIDPGNGDGFGTRRDYLGTTQRLRSLLRKKRLGETIVVVAVRDDKIVGKVRFRVSQTMPKAADVPGIEAVKVWVGYLRQFWPKARLAGTCVCKTTTSGGHSDHADCAAADDFDTPENMEAQRDFLIRNAAELHVKYVILYDRIYSADYGFAPRNYTGVYHSHVHVSFYGGEYNSACH